MIQSELRWMTCFRSTGRCVVATGEAVTDEQIPEYMNRCLRTANRDRRRRRGVTAEP